MTHRGEIFPKWFKDRCEKKHLSARTVAALMDVSHPTVCRWQRGVLRPARQRVEALADVLDEPVDLIKWVLTGENKFLIENLDPDILSLAYKISALDADELERIKRILNELLALVRNKPQPAPPRQPQDWANNLPHLPDEMEELKDGFQITKL